MTRTLQLMTGTVSALVLAAGMAVAGGNADPDEGSFCMDVEIEPFHMMPDGSCAVRDYWDGALQAAFYPFTVEDHLFNCETGELVPLPGVGEVPSSVISQGDIVGTIDGHEFTATLLCASLTNWYQDSCTDPENPDTCTFQLAQPFLKMGLPFPRLTEVSVFDGVINIAGKGNNSVPVVLATRAAGITHVEDLTAPLVGASITHSLLGMVTYEADDSEVEDVELLEGSADLLLQGHIFFPGTVEEDVDPETGVNEAAVIRGTICSEDLHKLLNKKGKKGKDKDDD